MGLAASQVRMLTLTSRKASIQRDILQGSNRKIALSREMNNLANEYYDALSAEKLMYLSNSGEYTNLSYQYLMGRPGGIEDVDVKSDKSMLLIDTLSGNVVLSQTLYDKMRKGIFIDDDEDLGTALSNSADNIYIAIANLCGDANITTPEGVSNNFIVSPNLIKDICAGKYDTFDENDLTDAINNENYFLYTHDGPTMNLSRKVNYINEVQTTDPTGDGYSADVKRVLNSNNTYGEYNVNSATVKSSYNGHTLLNISNNASLTYDESREQIKQFIRDIATEYFYEDDNNFYDKYNKTYENLTLEKKLAVAKVLESYDIEMVSDINYAAGHRDMEDMLCRSAVGYIEGTNASSTRAYVDTELLLNALYTADKLTKDNFNYKTIYGQLLTNTSANSALNLTIENLGTDSEGQTISATLRQLFAFSADKENTQYATTPNNGLVQIGIGSGVNKWTMLGDDEDDYVTNCLENLVNQIAEAAKTNLSDFNGGAQIYDGPGHTFNPNNLSHGITAITKYRNLIDQAAQETIAYFMNNMRTAEVSGTAALKIKASETGDSTPYFNTSNITGYDHEVTQEESEDPDSFYYEMTPGTIIHLDHETQDLYNNIMAQWNMINSDGTINNSQPDSSSNLQQDRMHLYCVKKESTGSSGWQVYTPNELNESQTYYYVDMSALVTHFYARLLGEDIGYDMDETNEMYAVKGDDFRFLSQFVTSQVRPSDVEPLQYDLETAFPNTTTGAYTPYVKGSDLKKILSIRGAGVRALLGTAPAGYNNDQHGKGIWYNAETGTGQKFVPAGETITQWIQNFKDLIADVKFYYPIVTACAKFGATTAYDQNQNLKDSDYLDKNIQNGIFQLMGFDTDVFSLDSNKDTDYYLLTSEFSKMNDPAQQAIITAWYETEKAEINSKETYWDTLIENLSAELNSINAEIESVQSLIDDAVKNTFDWGKGG